MGKSGKTVKILVCYHKPDVLLKDDVLVPINVGRALALERKQQNDPDLQWLLNNTLGDDSGENISRKNDSYNELTAVYWAWKNYDKLGNPDYIGLMHYRRHFIFRPSNQVVEECDEIDDNYFEKLNYSKDVIDHLFDDCDYVAHIGKVDNIYKHYLENHHIDDLNLAIKILKQKYPRFSKTADDYLQMSNGNFCNMFILPKKLFFEYCEWLFDILSAFEDRIDLSEKRLFISERLTGIYIEQLKRDGYKQKSLSATFIKSATHIPVAIPYKSDSVFRTAVMMKSILKHSDKKAIVDFYVLYNDNDRLNSTVFDDLLVQNTEGSINFVNVSKALTDLGRDINRYNFPEHYPIVLSEVLRNVNKALYFDERALFFGDVGEFYRVCNNDEFWVLGLPNHSISVNKKEIAGNAFSINCARLRKHGFINKVEDRCDGKISCDLFNDFCNRNLGYFPWWLFNITDSIKDGTLLYDKRRGEQRWGIWYHAMLYYKDSMEPWSNIQGLYSCYWWEVAATIPSSIPFDCVSLCAEEIMAKQSAELSKIFIGRKDCVSKKQGRDYGKKSDLFRKVLKYYKLHGLRQTIKRCYEKLKGGYKRG